VVFTVLALAFDLVVFTAKPKRAKTRVLAGAPAGAESAAGTRAPGEDLMGDDPAEEEPILTWGDDEPAQERKPKRNVSASTLATWWVAAAFALVAIYLAERIAVTGHGPFANQHEFAVAFAWGILLALLVAEWRFKIRMLSLVVLPVAPAC
jgi:hypothetical protein